MFLFVSELYLLGALITRRFVGKLPELFLAVVSIPVGILAYVLIGLTLVNLGVPISAFNMVIAVSLVGAVLVGVQWLRKEHWPNISGTQLGTYLGVGAVCTGMAYLFYRLNFFFVTTDSIYMVVMSRNLIESGLSRWYFASPRAMGIFVPMLQTLGMLFGHDYTWFAQPLLTTVLVFLFIFFGLRALSGRAPAGWWHWAMVILATLFFFSTNIIFISSTYIHTNLNTGLFLLLTVATLHFAVQEDNAGWLFFAALGLIAFGLMRIENVLVAGLVIVIFTASRKLSPIQLRWTFLPYLGVQFLWYLRVLLMETNTYTDYMSDGQLVAVLGGLSALAVLLFLVDLPFLKKNLFPHLNRLLPLGMAALLLVLIALDPAKFTESILANLSAIFVTGKWDAVWWVMAVLALLVPARLRFEGQTSLQTVILCFFLTVELLGMIRLPYHARWYDSANRMWLHIASVVFFFLLLALGEFYRRLQPVADAKL